MSTNNQDYKKLKAEWYKRLKEGGFRDVEKTINGREYLQTWDSFDFSLKYDHQTFQAKQDYYYHAFQFLNNHCFASSIEKEIWSLHAQALGCREIAKVIVTRMDVILQKSTFNKDIVNTVIRKLRALMFRQINKDQADNEY